MTSYVSTETLAGLPASGYAYGVYPSGSASQYMEANSVFDATGMYGTYGTYGITPYSAISGNMTNNNYAYYNYLGTNSDNMTSYSFKQRSNQHALSSYSEIVQKNLSEMSAAISEGEYGKASGIYDEVYEAISKNYGLELMTQEDRLSADQSIRATITNLYAQINGTQLVSDINENGEGYFTNGLMQGLTLGGHHKNSAEETESYMTGTGIENYSGKKFVKNIGIILGGAVSVSAAAAAGAGIGMLTGGPAGAVLGGVIGGVVAIGKALISGNSTEKVTTA